MKQLTHCDSELPGRAKKTIICLGYAFLFSSLSPGVSYGLPGEASGCRVSQLQPESTGGSDERPDELTGNFLFPRRLSLSIDFHTAYSGGAAPGVSVIELVCDKLRSSIDYRCEPNSSGAIAYSLSGAVPEIPVAKRNQTHSIKVTKFVLKMRHSSTGHVCLLP